MCAKNKQTREEGGKFSELEKKKRRMHVVFFFSFCIQCSISSRSIEKVDDL